MASWARIDAWLITTARGRSSERRTRYCTHGVTAIAAAKGASTYAHEVMDLKLCTRLTGCRRKHMYRAAFTNRRITRDPVVFSFPRMVNAFPASFNSQVSQGNSVASPPIPASTCLRNQHGVENFPIRFQADFSLSSE